MHTGNDTPNVPNVVLQNHLKMCSNKLLLIEQNQHV